MAGCTGHEAEGREGGGEGDSGDGAHNRQQRTASALDYVDS